MAAPTKEGNYYLSNEANENNSSSKQQNLTGQYLNSLENDGNTKAKNVTKNCRSEKFLISRVYLALLISLQLISLLAVITMGIGFGVMMSKVKSETEESKLEIINLMAKAAAIDSGVKDGTAEQLFAKVRIILP